MQFICSLLPAHPNILQNLTHLNITTKPQTSISSNSGVSTTEVEIHALGKPLQL